MRVEFKHYVVIVFLSGCALGKVTNISISKIFQEDNVNYFMLNGIIKLYIMSWYIDC